MPRLVAASVKGPRKFWLLALLVGAGLLLYVAQRAEAAAFTNPFWTNGSASQESAIGMVAQRAMSPEGVDLRTGELFWSHFLFRTPGVLEDFNVSFTWRSMITGSSQLGNGMIPSWETTAQYVVLIPGTPNAPNGHAVDIRRPTGRVDRFLWNGTALTAPGDVFDSLALVGGVYVLTDKWGATQTFNANGTLASSTDENGNSITLAHTGFLLTGITDTRGKSYTINHNANGYISSIVDYAGRTWTLGYDLSDNLTSVTTPATPDQPSGITTTFVYDGSNRLTSVTDGRGNSVWAFGYVGATGQISTVTIDGDSISHTYAAGVTTHTDRNSNADRTYFTGNQVTKTDMLISAASKYPTLYRYSGVFPANTVFPKGNRVDQTFDTSGNLTAERHRTTDTATNDASDLYHQWGFNSGNFMTSYTDPRGNTWTYTRDSSGNLTGITMPAVSQPTAQSASKSFTVNSKGQRLTETDEEGRETHYTFGTIGNSKDLLVLIEVDPSGLDLETAFAHDAAGHITTVTDPNGHDWTTTWDNLDRWTEKQAPTGYAFKKKANYDGNGNQTKLEIENFDKDGNQVTAVGCKEIPSDLTAP